MSASGPISAYKKKKKINLSKSLSIVEVWNIVGPIAVEKIAGPEYEPVPYLVDTNAYHIGNIFVEHPSEAKCFRGPSALKVLGPIGDFTSREKCDAKWLRKAIRPVKSTKDNVNFQVEIENGKNSLVFRAFNCYFLDKAANMPVAGNVTIDRSTHEDLSRVNRFGMITGVVAAGVTDIHAHKGPRDRFFYIGEKPHTLMFKVEVYKMDHNGSVYETSKDKMQSKWLPLRGHDKDMDSLPLTPFNDCRYPIFNSSGKMRPNSSVGDNGTVTVLNQRRGYKATISTVTTICPEKLQ